MPVRTVKIEADKAYIEYNDKVGGNMLILEGYPSAPKEVWDKVESMGGVLAVYQECISKGIKWEDLLGWNPSTITERALQEGLIL